MRDFLDLVAKLDEMAISNISHLGDWSDMETDEQEVGWETNPSGSANSFVSAADRRLITNTRLQERLRNLLSRLPHPINLAYLNSPEGRTIAVYDLDYGLLTSGDALYDRLPQEAKQWFHSVRRDEIGILLTHNEGGSVKTPLSPWMIVHRIAHALNQLDTFNLWGKMPSADLLGRGGAYSGFEERVRMIGTNSEDKLQFYFSEWLRNMATFKSARENKIINDDGNHLELMMEFFTQYMINGRLTFNAPPAVFSQQQLELVDPREAQEIADDAKAKLERSFETILKNAVGKVWVC